MSANLSVLWPFGIIAASDRRLTGFISGKIKTNRSTKMTLFACADAHGVIVYNGIGMDDDGRTPSDWLMSLAEQQVFNLHLTEIVKQIAADVQRRLKRLQKIYGSTRSRHSFVISAWQSGTPSFYCISNYERADESGELPKAGELVVTSKVPTTAKPILMFATGSHPPRKNLITISKALRAGLHISHVKALVVKAVKDIAYGKGKARGSVGASCQWAYLGSKREEIWFGLDVVGGAVAQETPILINIAAHVPLPTRGSIRLGGPGQLIKETYAGLGEKARIADFDAIQNRPIFRELMCGICGSPVPAAHQSCEVCLYDESSRRPHKRSRRRGA